MCIDTYVCIYMCVHMNLVQLCFFCRMYGLTRHKLTEQTNIRSPRQLIKNKVSTLDIIPSILSSFILCACI